MIWTNSRQSMPTSKLYVGKARWRLRALVFLNDLATPLLQYVADNSTSPHCRSLVASGSDGPRIHLTTPEQTVLVNYTVRLFSANKPVEIICSRAEWKEAPSRRVCISVLAGILFRLWFSSTTSSVAVYSPTTLTLYGCTPVYSISSRYPPLLIRIIGYIYSN